MAVNTICFAGCLGDGGGLGSCKAFWMISGGGLARGEMIIPGAFAG